MTSSAPAAVAPSFLTNAARRTVSQARRGASAGARVAAPAARWWSSVAWPTLAPVLRPVGRTLAVVTPFGAFVMVLSLLSWVAGIRWGLWELTSAAMVGAVLMLISLPFLSGRIAHSAELDLARSRVVVGERAVGAVVMSNGTARALRPVEVTLPVGQGAAQFLVPRLAPSEEHEELFTIPTHKRAILTVGPIKATRGDAVGLFAREVRWSTPLELFVHPRTVPMDGSSAGFLQDLEGLPTKDLSSADVSFHALRDYAPGDDRRHVHWKSSARTGRLMVRQFEETRRSHLAIALSANIGEYLDQEDFELSISATGSLGMQAIKEDKQLSVLVQGATLPTRTGRMFLDSLSGLDFTPASHGDIVDLAVHAGNSVPGASVVAFLCGPEVTPAQLRRAASRIPSGIQVIAVYCSRGASLSRAQIGDLVVLTVGSLEDLPAAMRRVSA